MKMWKITWIPGNKPGTLFCRHLIYGSLVTDMEKKSIFSLDLRMDFPYTEEGLELLIRTKILKKLKQLNLNLVEKGELVGTEKFLTPEGVTFVILDSHEPHSVEVSEIIHASIKNKWFEGMPEGASPHEVMFELRIPQKEGYQSARDIFREWDNVASNFEKSYTPGRLGVTCVLIEGEEWLRYKKTTIHGSWIIDKKGDVKPPPVSSSSIDAGMPGNEDAAWGSSSGSGWRVD